MPDEIRCQPDEDPGDPDTERNSMIEPEINLKVAATIGGALGHCGQDVWFDASMTFKQRIKNTNVDGT